MKLVRNLISNTCAKIIEFLHQIVTSPDFVARHRQRRKDFTRQRKLPFHVLIVFLINFIHGSYQDELDGFFKTICRFDVAKRVVLKAAPAYPAWWLFRLIFSMNSNFCARVSCTKWKVVRKFFRSGLPEKIIEFPVHATSVAQCRQMGLDMDSLKLRLIRIENAGKVAVLITSLIYMQKYPIDIFNDLYHRRWPIEEDYKTIKCRVELENFIGKSALSVYQDFHVTILAKNLAWMMAFPVQNRLDDAPSNKTCRYLPDRKRQCRGWLQVQKSRQWDR